MQKSSGNNFDLTPSSSLNFKSEASQGDKSYLWRNNNRYKSFEVKEPKISDPQYRNDFNINSTAKFGTSPSQNYSDIRGVKDLHDNYVEIKSPETNNINS
jgi:hypothetical protein